jgi:hypothetical protein
MTRGPHALAGVFDAGLLAWAAVRTEWTGYTFDVGGLRSPSCWESEWRLT